MPHDTMGPEAQAAAAVFESGRCRVGVAYAPPRVYARPNAAILSTAIA